MLNSHIKCFHTSSLEIGCLKIKFKNPQTEILYQQESLV